MQRGRDRRRSLPCGEFESVEKSSVFNVTQFLFYRDCLTLPNLSVPKVADVCPCKQGHSGRRCDECSDGYWSPTTGQCIRKSPNPLCVP